MNNSDWRPTASFNSLKIYARLLQDIRVFFQQRDILEVSVPCLASTTSPAPHLDSIAVETLSFNSPKNGSEAGFFLQTSPEFFMKRLLCSGSGPIYRMGPAFRRGESGSRHNPEFTMLEWYRPDWHYQQLMDEVEVLVVLILGEIKVERLSYRELFLEYAEMDPHQTGIDVLADIARERLGYQHAERSAALTKDDWLELILSGYILPKTADRSLLISEFPASQAELAETTVDLQGSPVARRFELYIKGVELANGYQELTDAEELQRRFELWNRQRQSLGKPAIPLDQRLIDAQRHGLPRCSGVALGVDRLAMCLLETSEINDLLAFPLGHA